MQIEVAFIVKTVCCLCIAKYFAKKIIQVVMLWSLVLFSKQNFHESVLSLVYTNLNCQLKG